MFLKSTGLMHYSPNFSIQEGFGSILSTFRHLNPGEKASVLSVRQGGLDTLWVQVLNQQSYCSVN